MTPTHNQATATSLRSRTLVLTTIGVLVAAVLAFAAASAPAFAESYQIKNYGSGKCAGVNWWEAGNNGAGVVLQSCVSTASPMSVYQQWTRDPVSSDGYQHFINVASGKCLDVTDGINADWTPTQQWTCTNTPGMAWKTTFPYPGVPFQVKSKIGGRCLDVRGGSLQDGAVIQIYHCTANNPAQVWTIQAPTSG